MKKLKSIDCPNGCRDSVTKKPIQAEMIGIKERTFVHWCTHCGCKFDLKV